MTLIKVRIEAPQEPYLLKKIVHTGILLIEFEKLVYIFFQAIFEGLRKIETQFMYLLD
jgi:hypothetical protein